MLAAAEFRRFSTYWLAILAGVTTQSVFGFIRVSVSCSRLFLPPVARLLATTSSWPQRRSG